MPDKLTPHEAAILRALLGAMEVKSTHRLDCCFPIDGGRIVMEAAFIPDPPAAGHGLRALPDLPRGARRKNA